ncbi:YqgE/AlgH family protein [soil metagenome]
MRDVFRPTLLLSMPQLQDPNFAKSVVLLCDFLPDGAFGLVLNRPLDTPAVSLVTLEPGVEPGNDMPLWIGGPVDPQRGWILTADLPDEPECRTIVEGLYLSTSPTLLRRVLDTRPAPRARVLAGYAGWGPGQLDEELAQSAWLMADVELDLVFDVPAGKMWETAIRRLGADPGALHTSSGVH